MKLTKSETKLNNQRKTNAKKLAKKIIRINNTNELTLHITGKRILNLLGWYSANIDGVDTYMELNTESK